MFSNTDCNNSVCLECAGSDQHIEQKITSTGFDTICFVCNESKRCIALSRLSEMIDAVFKKYVHFVDPWPERRSACTPGEIIKDQILECESEVLIETLVRYLHHAEAYHCHREGIAPLYDATSATYELKIPYSSSYSDEWERFVEGVKHRGRFYLDDEKEYLERIFSPILRGDLHRGTPPFLTLGGEESEIKAIYRGRIANTHAEKKRIFENPTRELAPPPPTHRTGGRMNTAGTAAFYGATDPETCVAELGVPFGGAAIIGKFEFLRPVRVLDFRLLSRASLRLSFFDPAFDEKLQYRRFVQTLRNRLRIPVLPGSETLDYLPTQMIAEFLTRKGLDGVVFVSSVTPEAAEEAEYERKAELEDSGIGGESDIARKSGVNIVLFSHASIVGNDVGPIRRVTHIHEPIDFLPPLKNWLYVEIDSQPPGDNDPPPYPTFDDAIEPTLELAEGEDAVVLAVPKSIEYKVTTFEPAFTDPAEREPRF